MMDGKVSKHESYGHIVVTRCSSSGTFLFGSDAWHHHFVHVEISEAEIERSLSSNWLHGGKRIIEFWMTEAQWAAFVSSFGDGTGTPITLRFADGKLRQEPPQPEHFTGQFEDEIKERVIASTKDLLGLEQQLVEALKPGNKPLGKKELAEVLSKIQMAIQQMRSNLPFIEKCFNETLEEKMSEAKVEFEGIVGRRLQEIGIQALRKSLPENTFGVPELADNNK